MTAPMSGQNLTPTSPTAKEWVNPLTGKPGAPSWLQAKVRRQAAEISRLIDVVEAGQYPRLAKAYVDLQATLTWLRQREVIQRKVYVRGYDDGWKAGFHAGRHTTIEADPFG